MDKFQYKFLKSPILLALDYKSAHKIATYFL